MRGGREEEGGAPRRVGKETQELVVDPLYVGGRKRISGWGPNREERVRMPVTRTYPM